MLTTKIQEQQIRNQFMLKVTAIVVLVSICVFFVFAQIKIHNRLIQVELQKLNSLHQLAVDVFENPDAHPNHDPPGTVSAKISRYKRNSNRLGAVPVWDIIWKQYFIEL